MFEGRELPVKFTFGRPDSYEVDFLGFEKEIRMVIQFDGKQKIAVATWLPHHGWNIRTESISDYDHIAGIVRSTLREAGLEDWLDKH